MGWNPKSDRFAPFQSAPRQCLGLNFAQMEMVRVLRQPLPNAAR